MTASIRRSITKREQIRRCMAFTHQLLPVGPRIDMRCTLIHTQVHTIGKDAIVEEKAHARRACSDSMRQRDPDLKLPLTRPQRRLVHNVHVPSEGEIFSHSRYVNLPSVKGREVGPYELTPGGGAGSREDVAHREREAYRRCRQTRIV